MNKNEYMVLGEHQVGDVRILVLDRDFDSFSKGMKASVDGREHSFALNSNRNWMLIKSNDSFLGKRMIIH